MNVRPSGTLVASRFQSAVAYFLTLQAIGSLHDWRNLYDNYLLGLLPVESAMALVHPRLLKEHDQWVEGRRIFNERESSEWCRCQASLVWGYDCPFDFEEFQADHLFPFAFGGPTVTENKVWLCPTHNSVKSADVHLFPWEAAQPAWLDPQIRVIAAQLLG